MSNQQALDLANKIENGLFRISGDAPRAMSTHEHDDTVEELRVLVAELKTALAS